jgi:hypothetical protein
MNFITGCEDGVSRTVTLAIFGLLNARPRPRVQWSENG